MKMALIGQDKSEKEVSESSDLPTKKRRYRKRSRKKSKISLKLISSSSVDES